MLTQTVGPIMQGRVLFAASLLVVLAGCSAGDGVYVSADEAEFERQATLEGEERTSALAARGEELYGYCAPCHAENAQGSEHFNVPAIAGMPAWYLEAQLNNFRHGIRGAHADDTHGLRMRSMVRALRSLRLGDDPESRRVRREVVDFKIEALAQHIAGLTPWRPEGLDRVAAARGEATFVGQCARCHGANAEGIEEQMAPPLVHSQPWYLARQIHNFQNAIRGGADPREDSMSQISQMVGVLGTLQSDAAVADVLAYVQSRANAAEAGGAQ